MKTVVVNEKSIARSWHVVDAGEVTLGRLASVVASLLIGKHKVAYSPNQDHGDNVIVINAEKMKVTGRKMDGKTYFRHSTRPGSEKVTTMRAAVAKDPTFAIRAAVRGMVDRKTALGRRILRKLHVYAGESHPHTAQKPQAFSIKAN